MPWRSDAVYKKAARSVSSGAMLTRERKLANKLLKEGKSDGAAIRIAKSEVSVRAGRVRKRSKK